MAHKANGDMNPFGGPAIPEEDEEMFADGASTPETVSSNYPHHSLGRVNEEMQMRIFALSMKRCKCEYSSILRELPPHCGSNSQR